MKINDWISLISLLTAIIALFYSFLSNKKKYELTYQYFNDILNWHEKTIRILISLKSMCDEANYSVNRKNDLLCELSSQIEIGRFYFPNIDKKDGYGYKKPSAYRGYRNIVLDFLVYSFQLFSKDDFMEYKQHAENLQRLFTSHLYDRLNPKKHNKRILKNTLIRDSRELSINEFLELKPDAIYDVLRINYNRKNKCNHHY